MTLFVSHQVLNIFLLLHNVPWTRILVEMSTWQKSLSKSFHTIYARRSSQIRFALEKKMYVNLRVLYSIFVTVKTCIGTSKTVHIWSRTSWVSMYTIQIFMLFFNRDSSKKVHTPTFMGSYLNFYFILHEPFSIRYSSFLKNHF